MTRSTMTNLTALADRVEATSGSDDNATRVLAREVLLACGKGYVSPLYAWRNPLISLDAAMTLVPDGVRFGLDGPVSRTVFGEREGKFCGVCGSVLENGFTIVRFATTPALALTAVALRARAQLTDGGSSD